MSLSLQECIDKIKKEYPNHFPHSYIEIKGKYAFNLVQKGYDPKEAISDIHIVDPETGYVTGGISIMEFLKNPQLREAWKKPNLVAYHDESLGHSSGFIDSRSRGWGIRRNQNGRSSEPQNPHAADTTEELRYGGFLSHYGIKGQSWGVKNGPPYPLDQKTHNRVVKDGKNKIIKGSGQNDSDDGEKTGLIPELAVLATLIGISLYNNSPKVQEKRKNKRQKEFNEKNRAVSEDVLGDMVDMNKRFSDDNPPRQITGQHNIDDDLMACNPRYKNGVIVGTNSNCTLCAFTYDLRRRGYDVTALASETGNYPSQVIKELYQGAKEDKISARSFTDMFKQAADKYPEGARGEIHLSASYFAHSMAWEIQNHQLVVMDPQRNTKYTPQQLNEFGFIAGAEHNGFIRTDNLKVNIPGMNIICAEYKSNGIKTAKAERAKWDSKYQKKTSNKTEVKAAAGLKQLSESQRRKNYEKQYLEDHPNADKNSDGLKNWVEAQMAGG